jgi:predicted nucleic acid-binding protein
MQGGERYFVDTNVILYSLDPADPAKQQMARGWMDALWQKGTGRISWQILNEFYANSVRKLGLPSTKVRHQVELLAQWQPVGFHLGVLRRAWVWSDEAGLPYWDALVLAAAETAGCQFLLTEDFQEGRQFGKITVVNPFRAPSVDPGIR